jgi:hypothetical protein
MRDRDNRLCGPDHLAGLRALRDHDTWGVSQKLGASELVLDRMQLGLGDFKLRLGGVERSLRGVVVRLGGPALGRQSPLALHVIGSFVESGLRCGKLGLGFVQGIELRLWVELGDKLVRPYHVADVHMPAGVHLRYQLEEKD